MVFHVRCVNLIIHFLFCIVAATGVKAHEQVLADPAKMFADGRFISFHGSNAFAVENWPNGPFLRSTPRLSATGVYQLVDVPGVDLRSVTWSWRVDALHRTADVRVIGREDFGAAIMFVFGSPSFLNRDVPTLAYVWTSTPVSRGSVLPSARFASLRYIQLRGRPDLALWQTEQRNIADDFRVIFGRDPPKLHHIAIFNDNDQTSEAASALFGPVRLRTPR